MLQTLSAALMDVATVSSVVGTLLAVFALSVSVFALDKERRVELVRFWRKWLTVLFVVVGIGNSVVGLYLFFKGPPQILRVDIINLLLHLFNLISIPVGLFVAAVVRVLDARDAKRVDLAEAVESLKVRVDRLSGLAQPSATKLH